MASKELEKQIRDLTEDIKRLRDELRVRLHLAGLEARQKWEEMEPGRGQLNQLADNVSEGTREKLVEWRDALRALVGRMRDELGTREDESRP